MGIVLSRAIHHAYTININIQLCGRNRPADRRQAYAVISKRGDDGISVDGNRQRAMVHLFLLIELDSICLDFIVILFGVWAVPLRAPMWAFGGMYTKWQNKSRYNRLLFLCSATDGLQFHHFDLFVLRLNVIDYVGQMCRRRDDGFYC